MLRYRSVSFVLLVSALALTSRAGADVATSKPAVVTYSQVHAIFVRHCLGCHDAKEAEGQFVLSSFELLMKGGENGAAVVPGKADQSPLVLQLEHKEKPFMPPPRKAAKLKAEDIALIRAWVDSGAPGPKPGEVLLPAVPLVPKIAPKVPPRKAVHAVAYDAKGKLLAVARSDAIEIRSADGFSLLRTLADHRGDVFDLAFSADGTRLAAASGEPGSVGEIRLWNVADGKLIRTFEGHHDAVYAVALSPDGRTLASGGYEHRIVLWDVESGTPKAELEGHNGAVFDLSFRADGKVLASASADRTLKLWDVATGKRLDTRSEPLKDLHAVAFSPDGKRLAAGGVDNRIRIWQVSDAAVEGSNPLLVSQFAHEGAILRLAWSADGKSILSSADDRTVKVWDASDSNTITPRAVLPPQADWPAALAFAADDKTVAVGLLDGTLAVFDVATAKPVMPPKPEVSQVQPMGVQRGQATRFNVSGKGLSGKLSVVATDPKVAPKLAVKVLDDDGGGDRAEAAVLEVTAAADLPLATYELSLSGVGGSVPIRLHVDDLPQAVEVEPNDAASSATAMTLPASAWGSFTQRGDADYFAFDAKAGQTIVFDVAARRVGSKAAVVLTLFDAAGRTLGRAGDGGFDGDPDPLLAHTFSAGGRYFARLTEATGVASADHTYRLSVGSFAYVTGCFPLGVPRGAESRVALLGFNLPADASVLITPGKDVTEAVTVPVDAEKFRSRRPLRVAVGPAGSTEAVESEPNDSPAQATPLPSVPAGVSGRIAAPGDADLYRFDAKAGTTYVIETQAAGRGSPADTRIEVLHPDGKPVERVQLRAVRDSYINFRAIDAVQDGARFANWEEMDLNQYMYMSGEVVKLFLAPRGPDSDYNVYKSPTTGRRLCYFDTTATSHALDEKTYIVEPHPPGATFPPNGLPVFRLNYENDDDADRELGPDSRLRFVAPADGHVRQAQGTPYLVRVTDTRSFGSAQHAYRLIVRPAKPDLSVTIDAASPAIPAGSGKSFTVRVNRADGFDGPVRVDLAGAPAGFAVSTPVVVEAGHREAKGTIYAHSGAANPPATQPAETIKATATATVAGQPATRPALDLGRPTVAGKPMVLVSLLPAPPAAGPATTPATMPAAPPAPAEITIAPGTMVSAWLKIQRNGFAGPVSFDVENLPHGVIVADIGLNGVLIPEGQSERQIFLQSAAWVAETDRLCHARAREAGNPTSLPVLLRVRKGK